VAGDTLLVGCDYTAGIVFNGVSDSAGDSFVQIGAGALSQDFGARAYLATSIKGGATTVTCTASSAPQYNEIYVTELRGVDPVHPLDTQVWASGPVSPAKATLTTAHANELVWAYLQSGQTSNASGWTALSTFDGNLIADRTQATAGTLNASFSVTSNWTLILAALNPAAGGSTTPNPVSVATSPATASVQVNQQSGFSSTVQNDTQNRGVTWSLSGGGCSGTTCGTLSNITASSVTYTAPAAVPSPATVTLTATSVTDTTKSASSAITITAAVTSFGSPTLVQHVSHSGTQTHFVNSYAIRFTFPTGSGNCVLVAVQSSTSGSVPTVTDDQGNVYSNVLNDRDSYNNYITLFTAPVTRPGSQRLQVNFSPTAAQFVAAEASEFMNVDPACGADGSASTNSGTGVTPTAGSTTTSVDGDLIYAFGIQDAFSSPITSWRAGPGLSLLGADVMDSHFTEWGIQSTSGTITPGATLAPSNHWFMAAMALKAGNSGTAPNGIHGMHNLHLALPAGQRYPLTVQFPCTTTTGPIVVIGNAEPSNDFTGLADSQGNQWTKRGAASINYSGLADIWDTDAKPTKCSADMTVTINKTGTDITGSTLIFIDVSDCAAQPCFDSVPGYASAGGVQSTAGDVVGASITPTTANGACFSSMAVDANSLVGASPGLFLASTADPEPADFQDDENNGYAVVYNPGTRGFTFTWQESGGPVQGWANGIACYKAP